jgi:hypothetical protein
LSCGQKWLAPFFTARDRRDQAAGIDCSSAGGQPHLGRRAAPDNLGERLLDANRTISQLNKIIVIFGRRLIRIVGARCKARSKAWTCPIQSFAATMATGSPSGVPRSRDAACNNVNDYGINKSRAGRAP